MSAGRNGKPYSGGDYHAPWWLPGGDLQTIYPRMMAGQYPISYRRERWETPDGDFIDLDIVDANHDSAKLLVLFHGLEGSSQSHYARSLLAFASRRGWRCVVVNFRGCSGAMNRLPRAYHSGDSAEIDWILRRLKARDPRSEIYAIGVSLGGNMLLKWLGETGSEAGAIVERAVAVSAPVDLAAAASVLDFGHRRLIYTRRFLRSLKRKMLAKISQHGLNIDPAEILTCLTFRQIDDLYTAPIHGFKDADDYWTRSSSKPWLKHIQIPTLMINARNDPFLPASALPRDGEVSDSVTLDFPDFGGHVGFVSGNFPGRLDWLPKKILHFFIA
ncbi:MAG: alpha/beta fold hydrolase [Deltaproteobacteria bacterium]|nr:alpha/beta fold hydrolase [Deltaproteobacteria bacterium]